MCPFSVSKNTKPDDSLDNHSTRDTDNAFAMSDVRSTKQEVSLGVASKILEHASLHGYPIDSHLSNPSALCDLMGAMGMPTFSYVVLVHELCHEFRLDPVEFEVMADPAGQNNFTVNLRIGYLERKATAKTKDSAQELAAEQMYKHLRTLLIGSRDFDEVEAMFRTYKQGLKDMDEARSAAREEKIRKEQEKRKFIKYLPQERAHTAPGLTENLTITHGRAAKRNKKCLNQKNKQKWLREKSTQCMAVQAAISLELEDSDDSDPEKTAYGLHPPSPTPGPSTAPDKDEDNAIVANGVVNPTAIQLLLRTMERLGI